MRKITWIIIVILAILVGIIPLTYFTDLPQGFLEMKDAATLKNIFWKIGFYFHIFSGGIAILIGWVQFNINILKNRMNLHRAIGKIYIVTALICSFFGLFIGFWATGGLFAQLGFSAGAIIFFFSTLKGYKLIRNRQIVNHQQMMVYSYAMCLGAINLRLFMTILMFIIDDYNSVYKIIAWMSWIPNLGIAYLINQQNFSKKPSPIFSSEVVS